VGTKETAVPSSPASINAWQKAFNAAKSVAAPVSEGVTGYEAAKDFLGGGSQPTSQPGAQQPQQTQQPESTPSFTDQTHAQSNQASQTLLKAQQTAISATPTGRVFAQTPDAQQGMQSNALYGTIATPDENGNYDATAANEKADGTLSWKYSNAQCRRQ